MALKGAVAAGHPLTVRTAKEILQAGGNAYDAVIAAHFTACIAEPVLASLGGGGFLLAQTAQGESRLFDFFVQTPRRKINLEGIDFKPILADFGATQQEFHIGQGSIATPGAVKGLFAVHNEMGSMPMRELVAPAIAHARQGIEVNEFQGYIFDIVSPILTATPESTEIFSADCGKKLLAPGDTVYYRQLADTMEALAEEGADLFYRGEVAQQMVEQSVNGGGHLTQEDLDSYEVEVREPLTIDYRGQQLLTNPPPSSGGILIAFALQLWEKVIGNRVSFGSFEHLALLTEVMGATNQARIDAHLDGGDVLSATHLLDSSMLDRYRQQVLGRAKAMRGTTHISVIDRWRNVATMTVSNGEGCGSIVPKTGIMLNNMLGEEDLNPGGFHRWSENQRMTSMMAPTIINRREGGIAALGSGGSNRIRTALLQTIINLTDFEVDLHEAIAKPRLHFENGLLNLEAGYDSAQVQELFKQFDNHKEWDDINLFFGGVHAVMTKDGEFEAVGDSRRGGVGELA